MNDATRHRLCEGMGMRLCDTCDRNADNHPLLRVARYMNPKADPPKCADWKPMLRAIDSTHERT